MLSKREKDGFLDILKGLPKDELLSLAQTVTMKQIVVTNRDDAVQAVLAYTMDAVELLNRKKMKREYLFRYLASNRVRIAPSAEKGKLVKKILEVWGSTELQNYTPEQFEEEPNSKQTIAEQQVQVESEDQQLAIAFSQWFYEMLNSHNPTTMTTPSPDYGAHHFYQECKLQLLCATPQITKDTYIGACLVAERLLAFVKEEYLVFQPNLEKAGVRGVRNPHGLCMVQVCGSIHQADSVLGIFEQQFGLVREPQSQNWKVKCINLKIGTSGITEQPTLEHTQKTLSIES